MPSGGFHDSNINMGRSSSGVEMLMSPTTAAAAQRQGF
jgi:hypothetical protein